METGDCHCHVGVDLTLSTAPQLAAAVTGLRMRPRFFHLMSCNHWDMEVVVEAATLVAKDTETPKNEEDADEVAARAAIVPYLGIHPWFSHLYSTDASLTKRQHYEQCLEGGNVDEVLERLPPPVDFATHLERMRHLARLCEAHGVAYGIGEIGLDKLFRVPTCGYLGASSTPGEKPLSGLRVSLEHQKRILEGQLALAASLAKPVSLHCVKAHGALFDVVVGGYHGVSHVTLHSYTGSTDQAKAWVRQFEKQNRRLSFSFSDYINASDPKLPLLRELVRILGDDQILTESDMPLDQFLLTNDKQQDYFGQLTHVTDKIIEAKQWEPEFGVAQLRDNALRFH